VSENPLGIIFDPRDNMEPAQFIPIEEIGRYDFNWH